MKAIRARFQTAGASIEGSVPARPKPAVHPTLSGPMVPSKKHALEASLSGGAAAASNPTNPKPSYLRHIAANNSAPEARESPKPKVLASRFENANAVEDNKYPFAKPLKPKPPDSNQNSEQKPKATLQKLLVTETKNTFPKPPPATFKPLKSTKPENNESTVNTTPTPPKIPAVPKQKCAVSAFRQQHEGNKEEEPTTKPVSQSNVKHSSFRAAQNHFNKAEEAVKTEPKPQSTKEVPATGPLVPRKKPSYKGKPSVPDPQTGKADPLTPKKKPLTNLFALGTAPSKPNRPPNVNLEKFKKGAEPPGDGEYSIELLMLFVSSTNCYLNNCHN